MTRVPAAHRGAVLAGVKAKPLRGGLRPALTPAPGGTKWQQSNENKIKSH
jgi:hypothetical protein